MGNSKALIFLLDRGANALATNERQSTSLIIACYHGADLAIVRRLRAAGVAVRARDVMLRTALHGAAHQTTVI